MPVEMSAGSDLQGEAHGAKDAWPGAALVRLLAVAVLAATAGAQVITLETTAAWMSCSSGWRAAILDWWRGERRWLVSRTMSMLCGRWWRWWYGGVRQRAMNMGRG